MPKEKGGSLRGQPPGLECGRDWTGAEEVRRDPVRTGFHSEGGAESFVTGMDTWRALGNLILRSRKSVFFWKDGVVHSYLASRPTSKGRKDIPVP